MVIGHWAWQWAWLIRSDMYYLVYPLPVTSLWDEFYFCTYSIHAIVHWALHCLTLADHKICCNQTSLKVGCGRDHSCSLSLIHLRIYAQFTILQIVILAKVCKGPFVLIPFSSKLSLFIWGPPDWRKIWEEQQNTHHHLKTAKWRFWYQILLLQWVVWFLNQLAAAAGTLSTGWVNQHKHVQFNLF